MEEAQDHLEVEAEVPKMSLWSALVFLALVTALVAVTAEFLIGSINGLAEENPAISLEFIALIIVSSSCSLERDIANHERSFRSLVTPPSWSPRVPFLSTTSSTWPWRTLFPLSPAPIDDLRTCRQCRRRIVDPNLASRHSLHGSPLVGHGQAPIPVVCTLRVPRASPSPIISPLKLTKASSQIMFVSVLLVNYTIQDGRSNWLEGGFPLSNLKSKLVLTCRQASSC